MLRIVPNIGIETSGESRLSGGTAVDCIGHRNPRRSKTVPVGRVNSDSRWCAWPWFHLVQVRPFQEPDRRAEPVPERGSFPAVLSRGANAGLGFLSTVLLARILGPEPYGVYALATTVLLPSPWECI